VLANERAHIQHMGEDQVGDKIEAFSSHSCG
jgi:hypothetical protein